MNPDVVMATIVDSFWEKARRLFYRRSMLFLFVVVCGMVNLGFLYGIASLRLHTDTGACDDYASLEKVPELSKYMAFVPHDARNIEYYLRIYNQYFEASFTCTEPEFIQWAGEQGWPRDTIRKSPHRFSVEIQNRSDPMQFFVDVQDGYNLNTGVRFERRSAGHQ